MTSKKKITEVNVEELNATQYFNYLKEKKQTVTDKDLKDLYNGYLLLVEKYSITGQKRVIEKLRFLADNIEKEMQVVGLGINSFVYRDDIEDYIDNISKNVVKIIELENYPRDIPDNIVQVIAKTKDIFDKMYVVFTDYTGKAEKEVAKERREKDPMLFGTFQKPRTDTRNGGVVLNDRFYFLGDWEDEYCDLTMDKFLQEAGKEKLQTVVIPTNTDEIKEELERLDDNLRRLNDKEFNSLKRNKKLSLRRLFRKNER